MKKAIIFSLIAVILISGVITIFVLTQKPEPVGFTPLSNRVYKDEELVVEPDSTKYVKMTALNTGNNVYVPAKKQNYVYRYGPSLIRNADGSIDAFFSAPGIFDEWDYIFYRHSPDGGKTWTTEKSVLAPTPDSADFYSCCDPGVVKFR
ncbi:MAG: exo-alpha-sialidase, partial [Clostridia bacterium]|nr:exo-alpha-sialidase [Clostridia bacterium]